VLAVGDKFPKLDLIDDQGQTIASAALLEGPLVLYFYPKDDTPGCTNEASQFRDLHAKFQKKGARIVGVSRDSVASHQKFKAKYKIPFTLIADTDSKLCDAMGVIVEKKMYGRTSMGIARSTFLIDAEGTIVKVWPKVSVDEHADEVLASLP
jgi:thioredoxin-dependent peroxiredoxin